MVPRTVVPPCPKPLTADRNKTRNEAKAKLANLSLRISKSLLILTSCSGSDSSTCRSTTMEKRLDFWGRQWQKRRCSYCSKRARRFFGEEMPSITDQSKSLVQRTSPKLSLPLLILNCRKLECVREKMHRHRLHRSS